MRSELNNAGRSHLRELEDCENVVRIVRDARRPKEELPLT